MTEGSQQDLCSGDVVSRADPDNRHMDVYEQAWTTATASAALLGITTSLVLIATAEPGLTTAVLVVTATAAHVQARLRANGARPPAEITIVARVVLAGIAIAGLLCLLGSVAWALLAALAIGAVPLLWPESRSSSENSVPNVRTDSSGSADRFPSTDTRRRIHVGDDKCVRIVDSWRISFFDAADNAPDNATNALPVPECNNADHETASADSLSTPELCRAWSRSYTAIQKSTIPLQLARISQARQVYLDALEARDPAGMARWLRAEPRADSDLTLYLNASAESERTD
jgi:hypothetical protein